MSAPGVELRWGYGFDNRPRHREIVRPFVREAIDFAREGLEGLELPLEERKYLWIEKMDRHDKWKGGAKGKTCHIGIYRHEVQRRYIDTIWLGAWIGHELTHTIHAEYVPDDDMLGTAASEGLAHIVQYEIANRLLEQHGRTGPPYRVVERVRRLPKREINKLEYDFWKASARPYSDEIFEAWFSRLAAPLGMPRGATLGIYAVSRQLEQGWTFPELITLPPYEVLDAA